MATASTEAVSARLAGKVVVVTGAAGGIGGGIVRRCHAEGARVVASDLTEASLADVAGWIDVAGGRGAVVAADLGAPDAAERVVGAAIDAFGRIDVLVNNGYWNPGWYLPEEVTPESWDRCYRVGPLATFLLCQAVHPHMRAQGGGRIINLGSEMSENPLPRHVAYAAAKGAIRSMSKAMARDWGADGITVNCVWPSSKSPSWDVMVRNEPDTAARVIEEMALGRMGDPDDDVAPAIAFLASDEARWITGQTIVVNGGRTLW